MQSTLQAKVSKHAPLLTRYEPNTNFAAVAMGSVAQFRGMGGVIGIALATTLFNGLVRSRLAGFLSQAQVNILLQSAKSLSSFPPTTQVMVRQALAEGFNLQMKVLAEFAAAQIPSTILMWQEKQILVQ